MQEREDSPAGRGERNDLLYRHAPAAIGWGLLMAVLTFIALGPVVDARPLMFWAGAALASHILWFALFVAFRRAPAERRAQRRWEWRFVLLSGMNGAVWGAGSLLLIPSASAPHQMLLVAVLMVLAAWVPSAHRASRWSAPAFLIPALVPLGLRATADLAVDSLASALLLPLLAILLLAHRDAHRSTRQSLAAERQKQALLDELWASEERMLQAQRIAGFGDWEWDLRGDRIRWSDEIFRIYDFVPGQLVNRSILLYAIHPADRHGYEQALDALLAGGPALDVEFRIVRPDGAIRYLRDVGELVRDEAGNAVAVKGVTSDISERVEAESKTKSTWRELNRVLENMQDTYFRVDMRGHISFVSRSAHALFGYRPDEAIHRPISELCVRPADWDVFRRHLTDAMGRVQNYEMAFRRKDGSRVWVALNAQHVLGVRGEVVGIEGMARDISDLKQALDALHQEKERALVTLQSIGDGVITTDEQGFVQYLNPVAERLLGYDAQSAAGQHYLELLAVVDEATGESLGDLVKFCLAGNTGVVHGDEGRFTHRDGTQYHLKITAAPMRDRQGRVMGAVLVLHDITDVMGMAQQLSYQASHDTLTGLFNRQIFERRVEDAIRAAQAGGGPHVVVYMDLDQFKVVNDTCGHQAGDELLQQVALLMQGTVRESDTLARLGGDEFGVLLEHCPVDKAMEIAEAIRQTIRDFRFAWKDKVFDIGVSVGVVPVDAASASLAEVLSAADAACYVAKDHGRNRIHLYQLEDDAVARRHGEMEWVHRLSAAFDEDRFVLHAQPVVHLSEDRLVSHYEVLVRMTDRKGTLVPPMAFIPAAERYNLMPAIDRWVVRTTFTLMAKAQGSLAFPPINCAINLSGQSLCDDHFLEFVVDLFDVSGIPPESICFEITETAAIANLARATRFIQVLRDMGCSFALDDFGSGLSSFGYLKSLAVDYLKIDGSFVKDVANDRVDRAMVESINQIGHVLGLKTIAEFVDKDEAVAVLQTIGVDYAQGYGVGHPVLFSDILTASLAHIGEAAVH